MKRKLFFAFSAIIDEMGVDIKEMTKGITGKNKEEAVFAIVFMLIAKVHKAKTTYIPFVMELCECSAEEAEEKDVEDVLKLAFTNNDVATFFT